jgi:hypothetical protein
MSHESEVYPIGEPLYEIQIGITGSRESELYPNQGPPETSRNWFSGIVAQRRSMPSQISRTLTA